MSEGLKALNEILNENYYNFIGETREKYKEEIDIIEKELKALSSIKDILTVEKDANGVYWLREKIGCNYITNLTREEYEIWKEVLKND